MSANNVINVIRRSSQLDQRRLQYTIYVSWLLIPVLIIFPLLNSYSGIIATLILGILGVILLANLLVDSNRWYLGFAAAGYSALALLYFVYLGYGDGGSALWIFTLPLVLIFMLGLIGGILGTGALLGSAIIVMSYGDQIGGYAYSSEFTIRFAISFGLVTGIAGGFEYWRVAVELEKEQTDRALLRAREMLSEFTSVCAWCNSICAADGDWQTLESYVANKEASIVSHAICPDCEANETHNHALRSAANDSDT